MDKIEQTGVTKKVRDRKAELDELRKRIEALEEKVDKLPSNK